MTHKAKINDTMRILGGQPSQSNAMSYIANEVAIKALVDSRRLTLESYATTGNAVYIFSKEGRASAFVVPFYEKAAAEERFEKCHAATGAELPVLYPFELPRAAAKQRLKEPVPERKGRLMNREYKWVGVSPHSEEVEREMVIAANNDEYVLITGETGVGKEVVARRIHRMSRRANNPFIPVNCSAIPESLAETELFGHASGAYTGASGSREGYTGTADGGVLFLDEIGSLPDPIQPKILRFLEDGVIMKVGTTRQFETDVRVIAATNEDIGSAKMRRDLFYRLDVNHIHIKPLRERREDIAPLAEFYVGLLNERRGAQRAVSPEAMKLLEGYEFPGNVRELENLLRYGFFRCRDSVIEPADIKPKIERNRELVKK